MIPSAVLPLRAMVCGKPNYLTLVPSEVDHSSPYPPYSSGFSGRSATGIRSLPPATHPVFNRCAGDGAAVLGSSVDACSKAVRA